MKMQITVQKLWRVYMKITIMSEVYVVSSGFYQESTTPYDSKIPIVRQLVDATETRLKFIEDEINLYSEEPVHKSTKNTYMVYNKRIHLSGSNDQAEIVSAKAKAFVAHNIEQLEKEKTIWKAAQNAVTNGKFTLVDFD